MRFSGDDSSAKLCIVGGEVSELPPDLGPTAKSTHCNLEYQTYST